jgi:hypothetical protein
MEVADQLNQADSYVKSFDSQIAETSAMMISEAQQLSQEEGSLHEFRASVNGFVQILKPCVKLEV